MFPIYKKEMRTYFTQMMGYLFLTFMVLLTGIYFTLFNIMPLNPNYFSVLSGTTILFFILIPALTMRLFSEETRHKTDQLLFTSPLSVGQIVTGKFFAAFSLFLIGNAVTMLFPLMISRYGNLPASQIIGAYIGYILMGTCFIAVGLFVSVMTDNQIIAAVATFAAVFSLFIMDSIAMSMPTDTVSSLVFVAIIIVAVVWVWYNSTKNIFSALVVGLLGLLVAGGLYAFNNLIYDGIIVRTLQWLSVFTRFDYLSKGIFNVSDVVYYLSFTVLFIYLSVNAIEKRRWR
jgi:ABC-2 type transport system permease protein